jgi:uncharacterized protein (DUF1778 family)
MEKKVISTKAKPEDRAWFAALAARQNLTLSAWMLKAAVLYAKKLDPIRTEEKGS